MSQHTIQVIEERLRNIFAKEHITQLDINNSEELLAEWKHLTNYVSDKTPVLISTVDDSLDERLIWQIEKELNDKLKARKKCMNSKLLLQMMKL